MGHVWYGDLGNSAGSLTNTGPFSNMQSLAYWSGTADAQQPDPFAWGFDTPNCRQTIDDQNRLIYAVAVRPGDVFAGSVPEPGRLALLLAGMGAVALARRRRTR